MVRLPAASVWSRLLRLALHDGVHDPLDLVQIVGLGHPAEKPVGPILGQHRIAGIAARHDRPHLRIDLAQLPDGFESSHAAGNREIENHDVKRAALLPRQGIPDGLHPLAGRQRKGLAGQDLHLAGSVPQRQ